MLLLALIRGFTHMINSNVERLPAASLSGGNRMTWWGIQYLRGIAAVAVVIFHVFSDFPYLTGRSFSIGARGVDLFFVISGFIMYTAARDERIVHFVSRRAIRIFPLYWLATALAVGLYFVFDGIHPSGTEAILSLLLIPHYSEAHTDQIWPILVPGWTLSYELWFYGIFALAIALRRPATVAIVTIAALVSVGSMSKVISPPWIVATNPRLVEFAVGLLIAVALRYRPELLKVIALIASISFVVGIIFNVDFIVYCSLAGLIVAGAILVELHWEVREIYFGRLLGDASYSIYLFHIPLLFFLYEIFGRTVNDPSPILTNVLAALSVFFVVAVGVLAHLTLEKPVLRFMILWYRRIVEQVRNGDSITA